MRAASIVVLLTLILSGCLARGVGVSPYGRRATLYGERDRVSGELIAVGADTIWLLSDSTVRPRAFGETTRVYVQRHDFGMRRTMKWLGWAGLGTGTALAIACNSYESSGEGSGDSGACLMVIPGTFLVFAAAGLLFGTINEYTSWHDVAPADTLRLRAFSRYPQGLPDSLRRPRIVPPGPRRR